MRAARDRYGKAIDRPLREARAQWDSMIVDLFATLFPEAACRAVSDDDLRADGFDPAGPWPDPDDYF